MTAAHEEKETLHVDVNIPAHPDRETTALFEHTRKELIERDKVCFICSKPHTKESPLEAHHSIIERCLTEMIDFSLLGIAGDPYGFVDDMTRNGMLLCKEHHTGKETGIHYLPYPLWIAQKYGKEGYKFNDIEVIHHV